MSGDPVTFDSETDALSGLSADHIDRDWILHSRLLAERRGRRTLDEWGIL